MMIQNVTEPAPCCVAPTTVVARDSDGAAFEAGFAEPEPAPADATDEDESDEAAADASGSDPICLEQFVQKTEIVLAVPAERATQPLEPAATGTGAEIASPPVTGAAAAVPDAPPGIALEGAPIAVSPLAPAAAPGTEQLAVQGVGDKARDLPDPAVAAVESPAEPSPGRQNPSREGLPELLDAAASPENGAQAAAKPVLDGQNAANPSITGLVTANVVLHQTRETQPALLAQPLSNQRHGVAEARQVARQLARQVNADHDRIEITLTPEELGKVRLVMTPGDTPTVSVYADNQDTLALLRRHADVLMRELSDTGFGGASLSFGEGGEGGNFSRTASASREGGGDAPANDQTAPTRPVSDRRLDIRI